MDWGHSVGLAVRSTSAACWDLQGNTWNLNAAAGSWNLPGGTVKNGTITETGGSVLILSNSEGTLDGITLNGNIDSSQQNSDLRVLGGLVLNGTITLGNSTSNSFGRLHFGDGNIKAGAVTGHGTILFAGNNDVNQIENASSLTGADGTFTIGPDIKIHGHTGSLKNVLDTGTTSIREPSRLTPQVEESPLAVPEVHTLSIRVQSM